MYYKSEALGGPTKKLLEGIPNATGISHIGGHIFPVKEIKQFLAEIFTRT